MTLAHVYPTEDDIKSLEQTVTLNGQFSNGNGEWHLNDLNQGSKKNLCPVVAFLVILTTD